MVLSERQRTVLSWAGCAGLLSFGWLLLPLAPARAEPPAKPEARQIILIGDGGGFRIALDKEESPEEKALRLLIQARKILAEQEQAQAKGAAKRPDAEQVRQAHAQVDALTRQVAQQRRQLQLTEARLRQAQARLAQLEGKPALRLNLPLQMQFKVQPAQGAPKAKAADEKGKVIAFPKHIQLRIQDGKIIGFSGAKEKPADEKGKAIVVPQHIQLRIQDGKIIGLSGAKEKPGQPQDLNGRLDRIQREIDALRRDLERTARPRK